MVLCINKEHVPFRLPRALHLPLQILATDSRNSPTFATPDTPFEGCCRAGKLLDSISLYAS
jgi:hypothetical protein